MDAVLLASPSCSTHALCFCKIVLQCLCRASFACCMSPPSSTAQPLAGLSLCNSVAHEKTHSGPNAAQLLVRGLLLRDEVPACTHLQAHLQQYLLHGRHGDDRARHRLGTVSAPALLRSCVAFRLPFSHICTFSCRAAAFGHILSGNHFITAGIENRCAGQLWRRVLRAFFCCSPLPTSCLECVSTASGHQGADTPPTVKLRWPNSFQRRA